MPINSVPVDQAGFNKFMVVSIEPRLDPKTGQQLTSKDNTERKWTVEVVAFVPSRWDASRIDKEVVAVTVTSAEDPAAHVAEGDSVEFSALTVGVMAPEHNKETDRIRGGRLFWQASGVRARVSSGKS